jgi:UDP-glucuronate decarboxylase
MPALLALHGSMCGVWGRVELMPASLTRNLITGGAGFVGSRLVDRLMQAGEEVICLDSYFSGRKANIAQWIGHPRFELIRHDVTEPIKLEVDRIWHLACPASPVHYQFNPIKTATTSFLGTYNMLDLARREI